MLARNSIWRAVFRLLSADCPKLLDCTLLLGFAQLGWLKTFKNSACKLKRNRSRMGITFESAMSSFQMLGPVNQGLEPNVPAVVFWQTFASKLLQTLVGLPNIFGLIVNL